MRNEKVESPEHYKFAGFQVIDLIRAAVACVSDTFAATLYGNVIKYVFRWPRKDGVRDLKKARWYLDALIERMEHIEGAHVPPSPDYDPASVAFRHGDDLGRLGEAAVSEVCRSCGLNDAPTAAELADADGCMEYGNPITPGCTPWRLP